MAKANKDGWIRHSGGECPVEKGVRVDVRYRDGDVSMNQPALEKGISTESWAKTWKHLGASGDIMAYRLHTPKPQQEPKPMTAEEIRAQYMENLSSIAMLHTKNAALVDDLRKLGFDFHEAPKEPQEDMSDPKNWRAGDLVQCVSVGGMADMTLEALYEISRIEYGNASYIYIRDDVKFLACREVGEFDSRFKFHSRPTK